MKNMLILVCFVALAGLTAWPQATTSSSEKSATKTTGKAETVQGTISQDGTSITADKDNKTWTISNPEAVKGHEGHHVAAKGTVDSAKSEITVSSVKMMAAAKTGEKSEKKTSTY
jgi:hypothetical protein